QCLPSTRASSTGLTQPLAASKRPTAPIAPAFAVRLVAQVGARVADPVVELRPRAVRAALAATARPAARRGHRAGAGDPMLVGVMPGRRLAAPTARLIRVVVEAEAPHPGSAQPLPSTA